MPQCFYSETNTAGKCSFLILRLEVLLFIGGFLAFVSVFWHSCCSVFFLAVDLLKIGIDILVGTPGRIKDHIENSKLDLSNVKHVVLDEVDHMLDMGFAEQVEEILGFAYKKGKCWYWEKNRGQCRKHSYIILKTGGAPPVESFVWC